MVRVIDNKFGACTGSLGSAEFHPLEKKLHMCAKHGLPIVDLFEADWLEHLSHQPGVKMEDPYDPIPAHLEPARKIGQLCNDLGLTVVCFQFLRDVEGLLDPEEREWSRKRVTTTFPFLRAFNTNLVYMTSNRRTDDKVSGDLDFIAKDLALMGDWAKEFSDMDGGKQIIIGFEPLSWGSKVNTWKSAWEVVKRSDHPNVGLVLDTFNILAVEYADPYNPQGHGRIYAAEEEAIPRIRESMARLAREVDPNKIVMCQIADAEKMDPKTFLRPEDPKTPPLLPWSRNHRLYSNEQHLGGYMPVIDCAAAVLATGYKGPLTVEVFNSSFQVPGESIVEDHAIRAFNGLQKLVKEVSELKPFW